MPRYKVFAEDTAAPFSHMVFYTDAQLSSQAEKLLGIRSAPPLQEVKDTYVRWCMQPDNFYKIAEATVAKLSSPRFYHSVVKNSYKSLSDFRKAAVQLQKIKASDYSNKQLIKILQKYFKVWITATVWGHIVNMSDFSFSLLSGKVIEFIDRKIKSKGLKLLTADVFSTLSTPTKASFLYKQEEGLYKLLLEINSRTKLKKIFSLSEVNDILNELKGDNFYRKLKNYTKRFDWIEYHYLGPVILTEEYFADLLRSLYKQGINPRRKLQLMKSKLQQTKKKQKEYLSQLDFSPSELYWINMAKEFCFLKGYRKDITFFACRSMDGVIREIARRFSLSLRQLQFLTREEVFESLEKEKLQVPLSIINQRLKYCVVYYPRRRAKVYIGNKAKKLAGLIEAEKINTNLKEFKGTPAFAGKVRGRVKVILTPAEMSKMKKGDVLVSAATNPNMMPALIKAAAIVTDEGGVTSHAAIVSRELGIPCVVGTKIATKVLKDGDLVEVDANNGIVKILKRAK